MRFLAEHYPTDVIAGSLFGLGIALCLEEWKPISSSFLHMNISLLFLFLILFNVFYTVIMLYINYRVKEFPAAALDITE